MCYIGRRIFIHHQCWEVLPFCRFQRQRCIKILCPKDPDFYTPLALKTAKGQQIPAPVVYKNLSPNICEAVSTTEVCSSSSLLLCNCVTFGPLLFCFSTRFRLLFRLFSRFLTPGTRGPGKPFSDFLVRVF